MQTRFWIQWRPIPGRPWVLVDSTTEQVVTNDNGHPLRFASPDDANVRAHRMARALGCPISDD